MLCSRAGLSLGLEKETFKTSSQERRNKNISTFHVNTFSILALPGFFGPIFT